MKKARGLPLKLGAQGTVPGDQKSPTSVVVEEKEELSKDSMRLSSLGAWLSEVRLYC